MTPTSSLPHLDTSPRVIPESTKSSDKRGVLMTGVRLSFRLDEELADVLGELGSRAKLDRSSTLRELIRQAGARHELWPPPALTEREVLALLEERARAGSVTATIALLRKLDRGPASPAASEFDELDGLDG
jgi:predicted transcriptional regulator